MPWVSSMSWAHRSWSSTRVDGQADHLDVRACRTRLLELGRVAELGRADRREVLGVAEEDGPAVALPVVEVDRALGGVGLEVGGVVAQSQCHAATPYGRARQRMSTCGSGFDDRGCAASKCLLELALMAPTTTDIHRPASTSSRARPSRSSRMRRPPPSSTSARPPRPSPPASPRTAPSSLSRASTPSSARSTSPRRSSTPRSTSSRPSSTPPSSRSARPAGRAAAKASTVKAA